MPKIQGLMELCRDGNSPFVGGLSIPGSLKDYNRDREAIFQQFADYLFTRVCGMFEWKNLPETLDPEMMEKCLLRFGYAIVTKVPEEYKGGGIYCLPGSYGGELNASLLPTTCVVDSTYLRYSKSGLEIGKDCVWVRNDPLALGLTNLLAYYCSQLADFGITMRLQAVNMRVQNILHANDDTALEDAKAFLRDLQEGKLGVVGGESLDDLLQFDTKEFGSRGQQSVKDTIEAMQWLIARFFIEIGLNDNYNMKREAVNSSETEANADTLFPLVDQWLEYRKKGAEEINRLYGCDCSVDFKGAWKKAKEDAERKEELEKAQIEAVEHSEEPKEEEATETTEQGDEKDE